MRPNFRPGKNIAMKVPAEHYSHTVAFYRDVLGFEVLEAEAPADYASVAFRFGDRRLWVDETPGIAKAEVWLEIETDDADGAAVYLHEHGCSPCNEVESLPENFRGFWIKSPCQSIHLVSE